MRHEEHSKGGILSKLLEGESIHIEAISILSPSMPTFNASSKYAPDLRGELMSISIATMTYPNLVKYLNYHGKESYFLTIPSTPCSYEKISKSVYIYGITHKSYNPFLLPVHKILENVVVDAFDYHKICKFHGIACSINRLTKAGKATAAFGHH
jgi:hypothetical protein